MTTYAETVLQDALHFDPMTPPLEADRIIRGATRRRRRHWVSGAMIATLVVAGAGLTVDQWIASSTDQQQVDAASVQPDPQLTVVAPNTTFDIGEGWRMHSQGDTLCLGPGPGEAAGTAHGCGVGISFEPDSTFALSQFDTAAPIYLWVVRDGTASAFIRTQDGRELPAALYQVQGVNTRIAVVHNPPESQDWELVSRNAAGTITDNNDTRVGPAPATSSR